jgi:hypothetical protein
MLTDGRTDERVGRIGRAGQVSWFFAHPYIAIDTIIMLLIILDNPFLFFMYKGLNLARRIGLTQFFPDKDGWG